jgi:H+/Cl- antiporter ClcA
VRLRAGRAVGRALAAARDPVAARVRPVAWGMTAALAGTMAANLFYLTMIFYYFYAFAILAVALPAVFARRLGAADTSV